MRRTAAVGGAASACAMVTLLAIVVSSRSPQQPEVCLLLLVWAGGASVLTCVLACCVCIHAMCADMCVVQRVGSSSAGEVYCAPEGLVCTSELSHTHLPRVCAPGCLLAFA